MSILPERCIDCGECMRTCRKKAIGLDEDDWSALVARSPVTIEDPTIYAQFLNAGCPAFVRRALATLGVEDVSEELSIAYDVAALAQARSIENTPSDHLPLLSTYCPAMLRLIRIRFPELLNRIVPVESPLEIAASIFRSQHPEKELTLVAPCPAKINMVRVPLGRAASGFSSVVSVRRVARDVLASSMRAGEDECTSRERRWLRWALRGGEALHTARMASRPLRTMSVSGLRNTLDVLKDLELGLLQGVDFLECRVCDLGCLGGVGNAESRFLAEVRLKNLDVDWTFASDYRNRVEELYERNVWALEREILPMETPPLGGDLAESMIRLRRLRELHSQLPNIDCGACGRPSCMAMAEDILRGEAEMTDCIFKLRERVAELATEMGHVARSVPHTLRMRGETR